MIGGNVTDTRYRIHAASLVYFDAVRRAGSIREAARRLNVASSAVNRQILALEAELQTPLFKRLPNGLRLTSAGEILSNHVTGVLRDAERLQSELDALKGLDAGHVELVTLEGLCHHIVPNAIAAMSMRHPRVSVGVSIMGSAEIPRAIAYGDADLGLAFEVPTQAELHRKEAASFRLGAVVLPTSPLATAPHLTLTDLRAEKLIVPKDNFANRVQLNPAMLHAEISRASRYEAGSIDLMKQLVLRGLGVALMTQVGLEAELASGNLIHVPLRHGKGYLPSALGLYARNGTALSLAAEAFAQHLSKAILDAATNEQSAS
ncbi:LysR family transcriptional regulator [Xanthobacter aminoxidans]|uniref:LysR family transcriptional regulator n=1 Tax=Xanthobacter aminoxidans TaxID=186280 RepID=UPI00372C2A86